MELHQLRYFVAVYETGSFGKAAGRCSVAQPSLSQQIQKLEKENLILTAKREERIDANQTKQVREVLSDSRDRQRIDIEEFNAMTERLKTMRENTSEQ